MGIGVVGEVVLWSCGDDYEAPHTLAKQVSQHLDREVSESEVRATLISLAHDGLVQPYVFDKDGNAWRAITAIAAEREADAWFMVTARGSEWLEDEAG